MKSVSAGEENEKIELHGFFSGGSCGGHSVALCDGLLRITPICNHDSLTLSKSSL